MHINQNCLDGEIKSWFVLFLLKSFYQSYYFCLIKFSISLSTDADLSKKFPQEIFSKFDEMSSK